MPCHCCIHWFRVPTNIILTVYGEIPIVDPLINFRSPFPPVPTCPQYEGPMIVSPLHPPFSSMTLPQHITWYQWPWLRNRFIGGTYHICLAYFLGLNFREYLHNSYGQTYGTFTYLHVLDPGMTIDDIPLVPQNPVIPLDRLFFIVNPSGNDCYSLRTGSHGP